jgi:hypothetical protein
VKAKLSTQAVLDDLRRQMQAMREASTLVIQPPSVPGIGTGGGFKMYVEDRAGRGPRALEQAVGGLVARANRTPGLARCSPSSTLRRPRSTPTSTAPRRRCSECPSRDFLTLSRQRRPAAPMGLARSAAHPRRKSVGDLNPETVAGCFAANNWLTDAAPWAYRADLHYIAPCPRFSTSSATLRSSR